MVNGSLVLALEKSDDFDYALDIENPDRKASKKEVEEVFKKKGFESLEAVVTNLQKVGLYLSDEDEITKPETLPHIISKWPIIYDISRDNPYGKYVVGYVKVD